MSYKYDESYPNLLIEHMRKGLSFQTFGVQINVVRSTLYEWVDKYPEFNKAKEIGTMAGQDFMEKRLAAKISGQKINGLNVKDIDNACLIFALKTRFHKTYGDKHEEKQDMNINITIDNNDAKL